jgi:hypothetical protein
MEKLHKIFTNLFDINTISNKRLIAFANDHVSKMLNIDEKLYATSIEQTLQLIKNLQIEIENKNKESVKLLYSELGQQLTKNVVTIAYQNNENNTDIDLFFDTKILRKKTSKKTSKHTINAYSKIDVELVGEFAPDRRIRIMNKGKVSLGVQLLLDGKKVGKSFKVAPTKILDKIFSDFYSNADALQIANLYSIDCICLIQEIS